MEIGNSNTNCMLLNFPIKTYWYKFMTICEPKIKTSNVKLNLVILSSTIDISS